MSSFTFFSIGDVSVSPSALRFPLFESSRGGIFFFFLTVEVKSVTTAGAAEDAPASSSLSNALAASSGAERPKVSFGEDLSSSTYSE